MVGAGIHGHVIVVGGKLFENSRRAGIVGGGIGGLTAAIALRAAGWEVTVYER
ncbi:NAD(P)-binding protein, partial [Nocardia sp. NPDC023852]|uniref:NAD(P)-binding protein n=1 Tax=Nocardia sp. NPDC023852 TaxID=3154697 RepID=UPI00340325C2